MSGSGGKRRLNNREAKTPNPKQKIANLRAEDFEMTGEEKNEIRETETAFALTIILTNFLLLAVSGLCFWFMFFVVKENDLLNAILRGGSLS